MPHVQTQMEVTFAIAKLDIVEMAQPARTSMNAWEATAATLMQDVLTLTEVTAVTVSVDTVATGHIAQTLMNVPDQTHAIVTRPVWTLLETTLVHAMWVLKVMVVSVKTLMNV